MNPEAEKLLIMQVVFGAVLVIMGMAVLFFMQSMNIVILYIAVALICITYGLTQLTAAALQMSRKE